ncbi:PIN domain-containing protein [Candidatus Electrothrix sp.]|uniref:PIN domain-containing protein n=1 Tax=Candidatus Electrothrix sp. TaxID=2170559 RepID=UPI004057907F
MTPTSFWICCWTESRSQDKDFEDAVLHEAAVHAGAQHIVTRNTKDFAKASLPVHEPGEFLGILELFKKKD